tara:strand:+ start:5769 stop:6065 length:297 start_codon:yes stop_codon:yes gene_type:complete
MITVIGFFLLVLILFVIYAPFNKKFFNIYKFGKYKSFVNLNDNSDLYSLINDFNSGLMSFNEFKNEIVLIFPKINIPNLDKIYLDNNYFEIDDIISNV